MVVMLLGKVTGSRFDAGACGELTPRCRSIGRRSWPTRRHALASKRIDQTAGWLRSDRRRAQSLVR
jgi:hypothetical protein